MEASISDLLNQAWRVFLIMMLPCLIVPVVGGISSLLLGLIGIRDEGLSYGIRVVAAVVVGAALLPSCANDVVDLMRLALH